MTNEAGLIQPTESFKRQDQPFTPFTTVRMDGPHHPKTFNVDDIDPEMDAEALYENNVELPEPGDEFTDITVVMPGKCIGRNKKPVIAYDVFRLAAIGLKDHEIANWFGVKEDTLRYSFTGELEKGRSVLKMSLRRKQLQVAMSGNAVMLIWLGKNLLGQSDTPVVVNNDVLPWVDE